MLQGGNAPPHPLERCRALGTAGYCRSHPGCAFHLGTELLAVSFPWQRGISISRVGCVSTGVFSAPTGQEPLGQHRLCPVWGQQGPCAATQEALH